MPFQNFPASCTSHLETYVSKESAGVRKCVACSTHSLVAKFCKKVDLL